MNIIQHVQDYIILKNKISVFNQLIGLSKISRKLNYHRRSKLSLLSILSWLMVSIFQQRSLYRAEKTKQFTTRTVRNVLNDARINWQRLTCLLAGRIIDYLRRIKTLDGRRKLAFVLDDTLIKRSFSKKTELLAKTYDHDRGKYLKGYRGLTLAITDGNTLLPVNYTLMTFFDINLMNFISVCDSTKFLVFEYFLRPYVSNSFSLRLHVTTFQGVYS